MRSRKFKDIHMLMVVLLSMTLAACGSLQPRINVSELFENRQVDEERVELTMWLYGSSGLEYLVDKYERLNSNVHINVIHSTYEDVHNNLQTAFASGYGTPDICLVEVSFMERFKQFPDYFYNLGRLGGDLSGQYLSWKWKQATNSDGTFVYGLPTDIGPVAVVYQTELFAQAGLPTDRDQLAKAISTWEEFIDVGLQLKERTGKPMIDQIRTLFRIVLFQANEQYFDADTGKLIVESNPAVREAWDIAVRASELGLSKNLLTWSPEWGRGIVEGDFATMLSPSWMLNDIKSNAPQAQGNWDITYLPGGSGNWGGSYLMIPKMSEKEEEAYKLIAWMTHPQQQLALYKTLSNFPSTPSIYEDPVIQNKTEPFFNDAPVGEIFSDIAEEVRPTYEGSKQHLVNLIMEAALDKVETREATPDQAWEEAVVLIKAAVQLSSSDIGGTNK